MDEGIDLFVRFVEHRGIDDTTRGLVTAALLVTNDERLWRLLENKALVRPLQEDLVADILALGESHEVARVLWAGIGRFVSPECFLKLFQRLATSSSDLATLHASLGAAVDHLRHHRGAFTIPRDMVSGLLLSADPEQRIIGLKAFCRHCAAGWAERISEVVKALRSENWYEQCGAVRELQGLLDGKEFAAEGLRAETLSELDNLLVRVASQGSPDSADLRPMVTQCRLMLKPKPGRND